LEYAFQAGKNDETLSIVVVVDNTELDFAIAFLDNSGLFREMLARWQRCREYVTYLLGKGNRWDYWCLLLGFGGFGVLQSL